MEIPDISKFRTEIDAIDDKIISLLDERSAIVKKVGIAKKNSLKQNLCFIRSGREAEVVRRTYEKLSNGVFPAAASPQIWRIIICASLSLESKLEISAFSPEADNKVYWLAREYFGNFLTVHHKSSADEAINDITHNRTQVGVLPVGSKWWAKLPDDIKIFACIPFAVKTNTPIEALAIARLEPEDTGNDITLLKITATQDITPSTAQALFAEHGIKARLLDSQDNNYLIECSGFIDQASNILKSLVNKTGFAITPIGAYAAPLKIT